MAMRKQESGSLREKRGTSPSPSPSGTTIRGTSLNSSKIVSKSRSLESSPSRKSIPNYLKSTRSSSGDATKLESEKPVSNTDSALKHLARRRSFDKPPNPARSVLKTRGVSPTLTFRSSSFSDKTTTTSPSGDKTLPKARGVSPTPTFRSSSFSGKSTTTSSSGDRTLPKTRGVSPTPNFRSSSFSGKTTTTSPNGDRSSKVTKDTNGKQHSLYARPLSTVKKSSTILGKKGETKTSSSRKQPKPNKHNTQEASETDSQTNDHEKEYEDSPQAEYQEETDDKITQQLEDEIQKVDSLTLLEEDDAEIAIVESPSILEEQHDANISTNIQPNEDVNGDLENGSFIKEQETKGDEESATGSKEESEDKEIDKPTIKMDGARKSHEAEVGDENAAPRVSHGKKDIGLSNDVIEETANKLQKQNSRVRALAGAFETVISLQDHK